MNELSETADLPIPIIYSEIGAKWLKLSENPESEIPIIYSEIGAKWLKLSEFEPRLYNIWSISRNNNETEHFEIGKAVGLTHKPIGTKLKKIEQFLDVMGESAGLPIGTKYEDFIKKWLILRGIEVPKEDDKLTIKFEWLYEKWLKLSEFEPRLYNIWSIDLTLRAQ